MAQPRRATGAANGTQDSFRKNLPFPLSVSRFVTEICRNETARNAKRQSAKNDMQKNGKTIFIGHGRSPVWHSLKDFVQNRLGQTVVEFNEEPVAGQNQQARLTCMLNDACFAFLIMTGEDKHSDGTLHARENVIHEIGLFQGRLKFEKAIVLLEDGCTEFSNIKGLNHIPFPKDRIEATFERIRGVLEREKILKTSLVHDFRPKQPMGRLRLAMSRQPVVRKQSLRQAILARQNRITKTGNQYD